MPRARVWLAVAAGVASTMVALSGASQNARGADTNLSYDSGQSVVPIYHGWVKNPDGTYDLYFGYLNRNWRETVDVPLGPNNTFSAPAAPDAGQPTHFLPRNNRWQFKVRVPADFGAKEVVWTLTSHGETLHAYGVIRPGYVQDEGGMQREYYGSPPAGGNKWPEVKIEGSKQVAAKVGQAVTLTAIATDDGIPKPRAASRFTGDGVPRTGITTQTVGPVGGDQTRSMATGLRFAWYLYRGPQEAVKLAADAPINSARWVVFDPPQFEVWEDQRPGKDSPWSPGWEPPAVPPGGRYVVSATFRQPGQFVLRALAHDGLAWGYQDVTVSVSP